MIGKFTLIAGVGIALAGGVLWGMRRGEKPLTLDEPPSPATSATSTVIDPVELRKEIEALKEMRSQLLPPKPLPASPAALQTEGSVRLAQPSASQPVQGPLPTYTYPSALSPSKPPQSTYAMPQAVSSPPAPANTYPSAYISPPSGTPPPSATSTPPAPVFTAAPGTRTFTVTTNKRFCEYSKGNSAVFLSGYPFVQDYEVPPQDIVSWAMTSVTFRVAPLVPAGTYALTVRGYQKYGYCDDVKPGYVKVE